MWTIREVTNVDELERLWMHKSDTWLLEKSLLADPQADGDFLVNISRRAHETGFFCDQPKNADTSQMKNYLRWRNASLGGVLNSYQMPLLTQDAEHLDIVDGFGRLLLYLYLVNFEGKPFEPFPTFFTAPV